MSKYFVTSAPASQYPYTLQDLRIRPPKKKRTGLIILAVAATSALCGGAAAFALLNSGEKPAETQVASLDAGGSASANAVAKIADGAVEPSDKTEPAKAADAETPKVDEKRIELASATAILPEPVKVKVIKIDPDMVTQPAPLGLDDPRWSSGKSDRKKLTEDKPAVTALNAALKNVEVAESEDDVIALEEKMSPGVASAYAPAEGEEEPIRPAGISAPSFNTSDLVPARATKWVNMRVKNNKYAAKLMVVPQNAEIRSDPSCQHWCRVVYDGRLGYIYRTYIRFPGTVTAAAQTTAPEKAEQRSEPGLLKKIIRGSGGSASQRVDP
ncbi:MAG: hypothetical protein AB3N20_16940 [Rhizobiaceae bacterium]